MRGSRASSADSDEALAAAAKGLDVTESPPVTPPATTYPSPAAVGALARFGLAPKEVSRPRMSCTIKLVTWSRHSSAAQLHVTYEDFQVDFKHDTLAYANLDLPTLQPEATSPSPAAMGALARFGLAPPEVRSCCLELPHVTFLIETVP